MPSDEFGQPISFAVPGWTTRPRPDPDVLTGRDVRLERLADQHLTDLTATICAPGTEARWTYMPAGPFAGREAYAAYARTLIDDPGTVPLAIVDQHSGTATGQATYLRIDPDVGAIEVGSIMYSPQLARTRAATECMYLMMRHAFDDLGYRRYEWKCDELNAPSRRAALRLGFTFEGIFRQATMYKGRNRDTAWFAITDRDWPALRPGYEAWLAPGNFDERGVQRTRLFG
jgi:RimJ/RimL family protein N-acetyltransferase